MSHPEHDCEDCGHAHFSWSAHERDRRRYEHLDAVAGAEAELLFGQVERLLEGASLEALELAHLRILRLIEDLDYQWRVTP